MKTLYVRHDGKNASPLIAAVLKQIVPGEETLIRLEKGIYRCDPEGCTEKTIKLAHLTKSVKRILFDLENCENLTIDGGGSELIFTDRMFPFYIRNGRNVTIRNLTIDFSFSRFCQGTLISCDETGFELQIDRSVFRYSVDPQGHLIFSCGRDTYSTEDRESPVLLANSVFGRRPWHYIFAGDSAADRSILPTRYIETDAKETSAGGCFTYRPGSEKLNVPVGDTLLFNYEPRANINILAEQSRKIRIENVVMYRGGGMGIVADHSEDVTVENCRIAVRPGRPECRSTTADGMFFTQCKGQVTVRGCTIQNTLDDALNIHGFYTRIAAVEGPRTIRAVHAYDPHAGSLPFEDGDTLQVCGGKDQRSKGNAVIRKCTENADGSHTLELSSDFPELEAGDILENDTRAADFLFENNTVCCAPHLRISDNGRIRIRNNRFEKILQILCCDLLKFWFESGVLRDLTLENNCFTDVPWGHNDEYPVNIRSSRAESSDVRHQNVKIRNNRFIHTDGRAVSVSRTDGVLLAGNQVEPVEGVQPFLIDDCTQVSAESGSPSASADN